MKLLKFKNFRSKLIVLIFIPVCIIFLSIIFYLSNSIYKKSLSTSTEFAKQKAYESSKKVQTYIENALITTRCMASAYEEWRESKSTNRLLVDGMTKKILAQNPNYLSVWTQFEYDKAEVLKIKEFTVEKSVELFGASWLRSGSELVQDYLTSNFEDYYNEDYYALARDTKRECVLEPFNWVYAADKEKKNYYETNKHLDKINCIFRTKVFCYSINIMH